VYGYGNVEKINGCIKTLKDNGRGNNKIVPYFVYSFTPKGDLFKIDGVSQTKYVTITDKSGKKIEAIGTYIDKGKKIKEVYKYDGFGQLTKFIGNANKSFPDTDRFVYDKVNNLIEHDYYLDKKLLWILKYRYEYSSNGVCIKQYKFYSTFHDNFKTFTKDSTLYLVFDSKNNWLKAVRYGDTITREIAYY
jgi:hypothetical protein